MHFRRLESGDLEALARVARLAFGNDIGRPADQMLGGIEMDRFFGAFDNDVLVGAIGAYSFPMTVPGGNSLPVAGTTLAVVMPTHRRRGILTELMKLHFDECVEQGDHAAGLWASEAGIYERFGYGRAFDRLEVEIDRPSKLRPRSPRSGSLRLVEDDEARSALREAWRNLVPLRSGRSERSEDWWTWSVFSDPMEERLGYSPYRFAVVDIDGRPGGYVKYRSKLDVPGNFRLRGKIEVEELHAVSDEAEAALWGFVVEHDLVSDVHAGNLPTDSVIASILVDHRTAHRRLVEGGWFRLFDVPAAWVARSYSHDGQLVVSVTDPMVPANDGTWRLTVTDGIGVCERVDGEPDLTARPQALGATYFGAVTWRDAHAAGLAEASPGVIARADRIFAADTAPWFDFF